MTPLVVVEKSNEKISFYLNSDFEEWSKKQKDLKKWDISYKKGLAALQDEEYKEIIQNPKLFAVSGGKELKPTLDAWFASDPLIRKQRILGINEKQNE